MSEYTNFRERVYRSLPKSNLEFVSADDSKSISNEFPELPENYSEFLTKVGFGTFGEMGFTIYGGPLDADEIFDKTTASSLNNYIFIGDDYSGWMLAYDTSVQPHELVFFNHSELVPFEKGKEPKTIQEFLVNELFPDISRL